MRQLADIQRQARNNRLAILLGVTLVRSIPRSLRQGSENVATASGTQGWDGEGGIVQTCDQGGLGR